MILYFASNLIWATRIKSLADDLGLPARPVRTPDMLDARLADSPVQALVVDLDAGDPAIALIRHLRAAAPAPTPPGADAPPSATSRPIRVVAFGPHVARDLLQRAKEAGADEVLTRGAFDHNLPEILKTLAT